MSDTIITIVEHSEGKLKGATLAAVAVARQAAEAVGGRSVLLLIGSGTGAVADEASKYGDILHVDDPTYSDYKAESWAPVIAEVVRSQSARLVLATATTLGKDLMPRVSALCDAGMASDISGFLGLDATTLRVKRPMWAGNVIGTVEVDGTLALATVRATEFDPAPPLAAPGTVTSVSVTPPAAADRTRLVGIDRASSGNRPDPTEAKVVVSGGRGMKGPENFPMLEQLTDLMGGGIGASRAACDAGWVPNDWQIGQTGKVVAPDLYFAIGISGAIQHLAGMKGSKVIVAINKDAEAPIFQLADYGLVADLFVAVPELIAKLESR